VRQTQFRECLEVAVGGRSILAILFEMGYLRARDMETLFTGSPPPPPRPPWAVHPIVWLMAGALPSFIFGLLLTHRPASSAPRVDADVIEQQRLHSDIARLQSQIARVRPRPVPDTPPAPAPSPIVRHVDFIHQLMAQRVDPAESTPHAELAAARAVLRACADAHTPAILLAQAQAAELARSHTEAERLYTAALAANPTLSDARLGLARAAFRRGDGEAALAALERAEESQPGRAVIHYWKGRVHQAQGRPDAARLHFERALALEPLLKPQIAKYLTY
jgi:hypothetical protein